MGQTDHPDVDAGLGELCPLDLHGRVTDDSTKGDRDVAAPERG